MNLEELKIKVSLDLKDLNKQLSGISDSINKTFTSSVKKMAKTADKEVNVMAKDINKTLNKAFTLDSRKFDADVTRTMDKAKRTVRSACKEIRAELNKAFNIDGHIRVTASSKSKMTNSGSSNTNSSIAASSQYTGAMIIKATNAIISALTANNNANTQQTISAIDRSTNRIIKALSATSKTYKKIPIKPKTTPNNSKPTTQGVLVGNPYGPNTKAVAEALKNATKVANIINKNLSKTINAKQLGTGSYGSNSMQGGTVNWRPGKKQSITTSFEGEMVNPVVPTIPVEPFKQIQDIIEVINFEVKDFETGLVKVENRAVAVSKALKNATNFTLGEEGSQTLRGKVITPKTESENKGITQKEVIIPASFKVIDDDLKEQVEKTINRIKRLNLDIPISTTLPRLNEPDNSNPQLPQLSSLQLPTVYEDSSIEAIEKLPFSLEKARKIMIAMIKMTGELKKDLKESASSAEKLERPQRPESIKNLNIESIPQGFFDKKQKPQRPEGYNGVTLEPIDFSSMEDSTKKLNELKEQISKIGEQLSSIIEEISNYSINPTMFEETFGSIKEYGVLLYNLYEELERLNKERVKLNIDTSDAEAKIKDFKAIVASYLESIGDGRLRTFSNSDSNAGAGSGKNPPPRPGSKNSKKGGNGNPTVLGFGFGAYKNELEMLGNLAKKVGEKIKTFLSNAFNAISSKAKSALAKVKGSLAEIKANADRYKEVSKVQNADGSTSSSFFKAFKTYSKDYGATDDGIKAIEKLENSYKKANEKIKKTMEKMRKNIANLPKKGLEKLASVAKTMWSKIIGIFKKGAKEANAATNSMTLGLKDLVRTGLSIFSLYKLLDLGKQAITVSTNQAASELRLVAAMKQRMNATDDTIQSVRNLISAQSRIGVLGKDVVTMGAQQLAYYTQSAEALEALIPRMNNLLVRQEGFNASIEQAQEMAVRLGEALSENSLEPLRSADIPITDAEVETFKKLRTEEEKVAYLTALIDERVGNLNESLAQTPYGAIQQLKNNFSALLGTLGMIIVNAIQPLVQWLNVVVVACDNALKALAGLFGFSFEGAGFADSLSGGLNTGGVDSTTDSFKDAADAANEATEANEKFKGSLAGFDEINILSDNSSKSEEESGLDIPVTPGYDIPTITPTDNGAIDIMSDKMKAFIDEVLEPFKKAWELYGNDLKEEWADLKESFKNFCDSLASFLKSVWDNGGKEFVQHMAEIGLACAKAAMEIGGEILDSLARLWEHLDPSKNMHTQRLLDVLNEVSEKIRDFILGLGDHFESLMANGGQDVLNAMGDCFMDLGAAAVNGLGVAIDALDGLIDHLDPAVNENTRNMLQALADMFHAVGEAAWDFSELLKSALANGGQDMINAFGDMMMNLGETVARVITTMMESFSKFFEYIDPKNNDITKNMMKSWEEAFLAIGDAALQFAELFESVMDNGGQEVLNKLGDAFNSLVGLAGTCVQEISDAMNGLFEHLDPKTNEFTQGMLKAWEEAFESISGMAKDIGEVLGSIMDNGGQDIVNAIGDLGVRILGAFGKVTGTVADCVGELFKHLDPAENKIAKGALESFEYFIDSIGNFVDSLADALGTFMDNGGQEFINNMADIIAIIGDFAATIGGDIINTISAFFDSWAGQLVIEAVARVLELVSGILKGLLEILQPLTPIISAVVSAIGGFMVAQKVGGFISTLVTVFQSLGGAGGILTLVQGGFSALWGVLMANPIAATVAAIVGIVTALVAAYNKCEWFREGVDAIFGAFKGTFDSIRELLSNLLEDITKIFQNIIDIIVGVFTGDGERVGKALRELIGNLLKLAGDLIKGFLDIGINLIDSIVKGLWEGIKLAFTAVKEIFLNLGEFIVDVFKGFFGINSPSKVFKGFGGDIVQGLIDGVTGMVSKAVKAISDLGKAILEGAKTIVKDTVAKFKEVKDGVVEKLKETREKAAEKWSEIKEDAGNYCSKLVETAQNKYSKVKDKVSGILSETAKDMSKKWEDMKKDTADKCKSIYDDVTTKFSNTKKDAINALGNIKQEVSNKWNEVKESTSNIISTMKENASQSYDKLKENLGNTISKWNESSSKTWDTIKEKTCTTASKLKDEASETYETLKSNLSNTLEKTREVSANAWDKVKSTTSEMISKLTGETSSSYDDMKEKISNKLEDVKNKTGAKWTEINNDAKSKITDIVKDASTKFGDIKNGFTQKLTDTKSALVSKWNDLKSQAYDSAKGIAEKAKSGVSNIGQTIATSITNGKSKVSSALDEIGRLFKNAKWELPKIKLPSIKVTGEWSFNPPRVPKFSIQWNKRGGIIDGITPLGFANGALQMGGEAGKEMVVPLENTSFTSKIAQAMAQAVDNTLRRNYNNMNNNSGGINDNRDIILKVDGRELARTSIKQINNLQKEAGKTLLDV